MLNDTGGPPAGVMSRVLTLDLGRRCIQLYPACDGSEWLMANAQLSFGVVTAAEEEWAAERDRRRLVAAPRTTRSGQRF
eukprot:2567500-Prymnesium_polylepis.1